MSSIFPPANTGTPSLDQPEGLSHYTGLHLLRKLRQVHGVTTLCIVLTVVIRPELDTALQALAVADIIHKPVRPSGLKQRVEAVWEA